MHAEIISVGTELLLGDTVDTNAAALGQRLAEWGIHHRHRQTVGDHQGRLVEALHLAQSRAEMVITIGGLGPTEDDLTRYAIAEVLGRPMVRDEAVVRRLQAFFRSRGVAWVELNGRQADLPEGGEWVANANGTALGFWVPTEGCGGVLALPGPPNEFLPMRVLADAGRAGARATAGQGRGAALPAHVALCGSWGELAGGAIP